MRAPVLRAILLCVASGCGAGGGPSPAPSAQPECGAVRWWLHAHTVPEEQELNTTGGVTTRWDDDLELPSGTEVQLRDDSILLAQGTYAWGWQPTFLDLATGHVFRLLHLRPQDAWATSVGALYARGALVGRSGGDTWDTGFERRACEGQPCSTGAHLCIEGDAPFGETFPPDGAACPPGSPGAEAPIAPVVAAAPPVDERLVPKLDPKLQLQGENR